MFIKLTCDFGNETIYINSDTIKHIKQVPKSAHFAAYTSIHFLDGSKLGIKESPEEILAKGLPTEIKTEING